jgi:hypothetical protein
MFASARFGLTVSPPKTFLKETVRLHEMRLLR